MSTARVGVPVAESAGHVVVRAVVRDVSGRMHRQAVIFRCGEDGRVRPFAPLIQHLAERRASVSAQRDMAHAVRLLLDYVAARGADEATEALLFGFADALLHGTRDNDLPACQALAWKRRSAARAHHLLTLVTRFTDWLSERRGQAPPNTRRAATPAEQILAARWADRRSAHALLAHVRQRGARQIWTHTVHIDAPPTDRTAAVAFDPACFPRLLDEGFGWRAAKGRALRPQDLRDMLIVLLLHGGGLRLSEVFHLYAGDVREDPDRPGLACVDVYHPATGAAPRVAGRTWQDRRHYLADVWGREPRHERDGGSEAGWKNPALSDPGAHSMRVFWFPEALGHRFYELFRAYIRVRATARHPYLFTSEHAGSRGEPYTIAAFEGAHRRAIARIGLQSGKYLATSPHAHRHAYGRALTEAGVSRLVIQRSMHHRSPDSQDVYTLPGTAETLAHLRRLSLPKEAS